MIFVSKAPLLVLVIPLVVLVTVALAIVLRKGPLWKRIVGMSITVVVCAVFLLLFYHDSHIVVGDQDLRTDTWGKVVIPWRDVRKAVLVENLPASPYDPRGKTTGISLRGHRMGWFRLANGQRALVFLEIDNEALLIEAGGTEYLFAPGDFTAFVDAVSFHVIVQREKELQK